jgi:hypothetical protein
MINSKPLSAESIDFQLKAQCSKVKEFVLSLQLSALSF